MAAKVGLMLVGIGAIFVMSGVVTLLFGVMLPEMWRMK